MKLDGPNLWWRFFLPFIIQYFIYLGLLVIQQKTKTSALKLTVMSSLSMISGLLYLWMLSSLLFVYFSIFTDYPTIAYLLLFCQMRDINSMRREWLSPKNAPCIEQLRLPDKGRAIKGLVVCNSWDVDRPLDLHNGMVVRDPVPWEKNHI